MTYAFRRLGKDLNRAAFSCGEPSLDTYLKQQASQDERHRMAVCHVLVEQDSPNIIGYYTLSTNASVVLQDVPEDLRKRWPKYPYVAALLLGRLAVDSRYQGQGIGDVLLIDALKRVLELGEVARVKMVVVDALHEKAAGFYERRGFQQFPNQPLRLFLPVAAMRNLFPTIVGQP